MREHHWQMLRCVGCGEGTLQEEGTAMLACRRCKARYPIDGGVPRFVPASNYAASFGVQWNEHRLTQLDSHTGKDITRKRLLEVSGWREDLRGESVLEAGCGAGRFTEILLAMGAVVCSFDYSSAVEANAASNGPSDRLTLFQADIFDVPAALGSFDKVLCLGVLQHTPDPARAFRSLVRHLKPGGQIVIDVYARRLSALLSWKYALRPLTKRMDPKRLYGLVQAAVDLMLPLAAALKRAGGRLGGRLLPIVEYSQLDLPPSLNRQWAILDTFDMYSPAYDHPQTEEEVRQWFALCRMENVMVRPGPNGIVGRGQRPTGLI